MGRPDLSNLLSRARTAWHRTGDLIVAAACFVLSLLLYLRTLAPTVVSIFDDTLEFPLAVKRMAIAHPTGYPLYLLLGKLFSLLPWRDVAGRVNLLSAVAGAAAVALVFLVARKMVRRRWTALAGAGALAVSPVFWSQAVVAEVYSLNAAFVAGLLLAVLCWARKPLLEPRQAGKHAGSGATGSLGEEPRQAGDVPAGTGAVPDLPEEPQQDGDSKADGDGVAGFSGEEAAEAGEQGSAQAAAAQPSSLQESVRPAPGVRDVMSVLGRRIQALFHRLLPEVPAEARLRLHPSLYGLAALLGLALTHHRTVLLLVPALLVFVLLTERRIGTRAALLGPEHPERPGWRRFLARPVFLLLVAFFLPLLLYLYLPIRGHVGSLDGTFENTWRGFWHWILASSYGSFLGENPLARSTDAAGFAGLFWAQFGPLGLALTLLGITGLLRRPRLLALTGTAFLSFLLFGVLYRAPDLEVFFVPAFLVAAVWAAVGLDHALELLRIRGRSLALRRLQGATGLLLVLGAIVQVVVTGTRAFPTMDLSQRWQVSDLAQYWLRPALAPEGSVVGLLGEMTLIRYFQETEGLAPGLRTVVADDPAARLAVVLDEVAQGQPVYVTRSLEGLAARYSLSAVAGAVDIAGQAEALVRVSKPAYDAVGPPNPVSIEVAPGVELLGHSLSERSAHGQAWVTLQLWWRAAREVDLPLKVSARLVDAQGDVTAAVDGEPVAWTYPATSWRPGEVVADAYEIPWPAGTAPGLYTPLVILYDPGEGKELGRIELPARALSGSPLLPAGGTREAALVRTTRARFGALRLLGFTLLDAAVPSAASGTWALTFLWQAVRPVGGDLRLEVRLAGASAPLAEALVGGAYPTSRWADGQAVRQVVRLSLPADLAPGSYQLMLRLIAEGRPLAWSWGILPGGSDFDLGTIVVQ